MDRFNAPTDKPVILEPENGNLEKSSPDFAAPSGMPVIHTDSDFHTSNQAMDLNQGLGEKHRVHHSYIWLSVVRTTAILLFFFLVSSASSIASLISELSDSFGDPEESAVLLIASLLCIGAVILIAAIVFLCYWLSYKNLYYVITADEFNLYKGVINKTRVHVPYNKIQSVDQKATLLQRIVGVRTLYIDTAGGSNNKSIIVPYLTKHDAEWLRSELFARKSIALGEKTDTPSINAPQQTNVLDVGQKMWDDIGGVFAGESYVDASASFEYGLTNKELVLAGLSNRTSFILILFGIILALSQVFGTFLDIFPDQEDVFDSVVSDAGSAMMGMGILALASLLIGILIVVWIIGIIGTCIGYGGFKATRRANRIEVQYGLLQHTFQGVDVDRVQAVIVKESFIRRIFGYCEISLAKVDAASEGDSSNQKMPSEGIVVHPFVKLSKVPEILKGLIPEFAYSPSEEHKVAPVALRRAIIRRCIIQGPGFWIAVFTLIFQICIAPLFATDPLMIDDEIVYVYGFFDAMCAFLYSVAIVVTILNLIGAILWARGSSFSYDRRFTQVVNGGYSTTTTTIPKRKIQFGDERTNPLQRLAKTATLNIRTAAGIGGTTVTLIDAASKDVENWLVWLEPRSIASQIADSGAV